MPQLRKRAGALYDAMNFGFYYRRRGRTASSSTTCPTPARRPCCYDTVVSESRIADYIGIGRGQMPQKAYYGRWRTFPDTCDYSLAGDQAGRRLRSSYFGVDVFEGAYEYNNTRLVPSWGGNLFEALMPALFVPEEKWAPNSWGANHPLTVAGADLPRPQGGRLRLLGLLGRRTCPRAATASTASTAPA